MRIIMNNREQGKCKFSKALQRKYRMFLCVLCFVDLLVFGILYLREIDSRIPNHIYYFENQNAKSVYSSLDTPITVSSGQIEEDGTSLKLFGILPYKYIHFDKITQEKVMPSGRAVGMYIRSSGVMVLGTTKVQGKDGLSYEPAKDILLPGDRIKKIEQTRVYTIDDVAKSVAKSQKNKLTLAIDRDGDQLQVRIEKVLGKDGEEHLGVWLREDTEGVGTLSFVTNKNQFAALGHGITDIDTGKVIAIQKGDLYPAEIQGIKKGKSGEPGNLIGTVYLGKQLRIGKIKSNSEMGITGEITSNGFMYQEKNALPIGLKQQVKKGKAWILCQVSGNVEKYRIEITKINLNSKDNKGMVLRVTDKRLIELTGGIVQGMSGAPIIQNGKVIGAVTHVFVNDPLGGYGTFVENML